MSWKIEIKSDGPHTLEKFKAEEHARALVADLQAAGFVLTKAEYQHGAFGYDLLKQPVAPEPPAVIPPVAAKSKPSVHPPADDKKK